MGMVLFVHGSVNSHWPLYEASWLQTKT